MGLAERRRLKELKEGTLPRVTELFRTETGLDLPIEVDLDSFAAISDTDKLNESLDWLQGRTNNNEFWTEAIAAFKELAADEMGQRTIKDRIKSWRITYQAGQPSGLKLVDGVLLHNANFVDEGTPARLWQGEIAGHLQRELTAFGLPLNQQRHVKQIRDEVVPRHQAALKELAGAEIPIEVADDFAAVADEGARQGALDWLRGWTNSGEFWTELVAAFRELCQDDLGKEAVRTIKKIVVRWESGRESSLELKDGTLTYYHNFVDSPGAHRLFSGDIRAALEAML